MTSRDALTSARSAIDTSISKAFRSISWMAELPGDPHDLQELIAPALALMSKGKRTRGLLLLAASRCSSNHHEESAIAAAAALELYQGSALMHDDIIDRSLTRRSIPSTHVAFTDLHQRASWSSDPTHFGMSSAILLGDLLLSLSSDALLEAKPSREALQSFHRMSCEVAFGQYLDIRAEVAAIDNGSVDDALRVLTHKSARYSVVFPLVIGAQLANSSAELLSTLQALGEPLGEAFQLRDDELNIFGDPEITGKPACGDITEGKRTALLALSLAMMPDNDAARMRDLLGKNITSEDIIWIQNTIRDSGAYDEHRKMIATRESSALRAWNELCALPGVQTDGIALLEQLLSLLAGRTH